MKREGHGFSPAFRRQSPAECSVALRGPLRWQSQTEGPPPLDAIFAFGSMAPNPFWVNVLWGVNEVLIGIGGAPLHFHRGIGG